MNRYARATTLPSLILLLAFTATSLRTPRRSRPTTGWAPGPPRLWPPTMGRPRPRSLTPPAVGAPANAAAPAPAPRRRRLPAHAARAARGCHPAVPRPARPAFVYGAADTTLREIVHISIGGPMVRVVFTNEFGTEPLTIGAAHVAVSQGGSTINLVSAAGPHLRRAHAGHYSAGRAGGQRSGRR